MNEEPKTITIPESLTVFECSVPVELLAEHEDDEDGKNGRRHFHMLAHAGTIMEHPWLGRFAVDLEGIKIERKSYAALLDHDPGKRVGRIEKVELVKNKGLTADGFFLKNSAVAQEVLSDAQDGFPWQASIRVPPTRVQRLDEKEETVVNGRKFVGPGFIFRESILKEISFTALGADHHTSADALTDVRDGIVAELTTKGSEQESETMAEKTSDAGDVTPATITLSSLEADFPEIFAEAVTKGVDSERARVLEILEQCHVRQLPIVLPLLKSGASVNEALKAMLTDRRGWSEQWLADAAAHSDEPVSPNLDADQGSRANLTIEEECAEKWKASAELRSEFMDNLETYVAYRKAAASDLLSFLDTDEGRS